MTDAMLLRVSGLSKQELHLLRDTLAKSTGITRAWVFGSRAKGMARAASDIDIAIEGRQTLLQVEAVRDCLNDLPLPYTVDVQAVESIKSSALQEHISRCGILLFERSRRLP